MFESRKRQKSEKIQTLIGENTEIKGGVVFEGGLHVDGIIRGNVEAKQGAAEAVLTISRSAEIEGNVYAPHVVLDGVVHGDIHGSGTVELAENAKVIGNIYYNRLEMAMGAAVNGQLVHESEKEQHIASADESAQKDAETALESAEELSES